MEWDDVKQVVRLWSVRPWLYNWTVYPLSRTDQEIDITWRHWFADTGLSLLDVEGQRKSQSKKNFMNAEKVIKIYEVVFQSERTFKKQDSWMKQLMHIIQSLQHADEWLAELVRQTRRLSALMMWMRRIPSDEVESLLLLIFICYNYCLLLRVIERCDNGFEDVKQWMFQEKDEVETLRQSGNFHFKNMAYTNAVLLYTRGIEIERFNHKLYANRSQAFLNMDKSFKAAFDGLRCIQINLAFPKGWYRCVQGLIRIEKYDRAYFYIQQAHTHCPDDEPLRKLEEELIPKLPAKLAAKIKKPKSLPIPLKKLSKQKEEAAKGKENYESNIQGTQNMSEPTSGGTAVSGKPSSSEKGPSATKQTTRREVKKKKSAECDTPGPAGNTGTQADMKILIRNIKDNLQQGSQALVGKRMRNAVSFYMQAFEAMDSKIIMEMRYHDDQVAVIHYAIGICNINFNTLREIEEGLHHFRLIIEKFTDLKFPLAYLGMGMAYYKSKRFKSAVKPLTTGLRLATIHELDHVHTWPESTVCIDNSRKDKMREAFERYLMLSQYPPQPDAICRFTECNHYNTTIYLSEPDFKGYVIVHCYAKCKIAYHHDCWKKYKPKSIKEIFSGTCFTPDCMASLSKIVFFDHTGDSNEKKNELVIEHLPRRPALKMQASSQHTLRRKAERKERRKKKKAGCIAQAKAADTVDVDQLVTNIETTASAAEVLPAPEVDLYKCTTILPKRLEEEELERREEESKKQKRKRKPAKGRVSMPLSEFIQPEDDGMDMDYYDHLCETDPYAGLDDFREEEAQLYASDSPCDNDADGVDSESLANRYEGDSVSTGSFNDERFSATSSFDESPSDSDDSSDDEDDFELETTMREGDIDDNVNDDDIDDLNNDPDVTTNPENMTDLEDPDNDEGSSNQTAVPEPSLSGNVRDTNFNCKGDKAKALSVHSTNKSQITVTATKKGVDLTDYLKKLYRPEEGGASGGKVTTSVHMVRNKDNPTTWDVVTEANSAPSEALLPQDSKKHPSQVCTKDLDSSDTNKIHAPPRPPPGLQPVHTSSPSHAVPAVPTASSAPPVGPSSLFSTAKDHLSHTSSKLETLESLQIELNRLLGVGSAEGTTGGMVVDTYPEGGGYAYPSEDLERLRNGQTCEEVILQWQQEREDLLKKNGILQELYKTLLKNESGFNQKMKDLEETVKRGRDLVKATEHQYEEMLNRERKEKESLKMKYHEEKQRAQNAEVALLQYKFEMGMDLFERSAAEAEATINKICMEGDNYRSQNLPVPKENQVALEAWMKTSSEIQKARIKAKSDFQDQILKVRHGRRLDSFPEIPRPPRAPPNPFLGQPPPIPVSTPSSSNAPLTEQDANMGEALSSCSSDGSVASGKSTPPTMPARNTVNKKDTISENGLLGATAASSAPRPPVMKDMGTFGGAFGTASKSSLLTAVPKTGTTPKQGINQKQAVSQKNSFQRVIEIIQYKHPYFTRDDIGNFIKELRMSRNGSLSGMSMEDVTRGVQREIEKVLKQQQKVAADFELSEPRSDKFKSANKLEPAEEVDPCIICLEELDMHMSQMLDCGHRYHTVCIKKWFETKAVCPLCQNYSLLSEEFPPLSCLRR